MHQDDGVPAWADTHPFTPYKPITRLSLPCRVGQGDQEWPSGHVLHAWLLHPGHRHWQGPRPEPEGRELPAAGCWCILIDVQLLSCVRMFTLPLSALHAALLNDLEERCVSKHSGASLMGYMAAQWILAFNFIPSLPAAPVGPRQHQRLRW